jgi:2'-5' RNA ligase
MVRLFTAIELTPDVRGAIVRCQSNLAAALREAGAVSPRMVRPAELHLTLAFIGDVAEGRVPAVASAVHEGFAVPRFEVEFGGCGVFPPRGPARVLWLGIRQGNELLTRLFADVSGRLRRIGIIDEPRLWSPHVTLGRWRSGLGPRSAAGLPALGRVGVQEVGDVVLVRSRLLPSGPEHVVLVRGGLLPAA